MAKSSIARTMVTLLGDGLNDADTWADEINTASPGQRLPATALANGDNAFTVPTGAKNLYIAKPSAVINLKKVGGDAGVPIAQVGQVTKIPVVAGATLILNVSGAQTADLYWV